MLHRLHYDCARSPDVPLLHNLLVVTDDLYLLGDQLLSLPDRISRPDLCRTCSCHNTEHGSILLCHKTFRRFVRFLFLQKHLIEPHIKLAP